LQHVAKGPIAPHNEKNFCTKMFQVNQAFDV